MGASPAVLFIEHPHMIKFYKAWNTTIVERGTMSVLP